MVVGTVPDLLRHRENIRRCRGMMGIQECIYRSPDFSQHLFLRTVIFGLYGNGHQAVLLHVSLPQHFGQQQFNGLFAGFMAHIHVFQDGRPVIIVWGCLQHKAEAVERKGNGWIHIHIHISAGRKTGKAAHEQKQGKAGTGGGEPLPSHPCRPAAFPDFPAQVFRRPLLQVRIRMDFIKGTAKLTFHPTHLPTAF